MNSARDWEEPTFGTPPITRIPIKTSLSNVLLMSNPWEQRDLDKKLAHIAKEKQRREKVLEWNQRHFFVTKIFDADYKLRFTQDQQQYSDELKEENLKKKKKRKSKGATRKSVDNGTNILVTEKTELQARAVTDYLPGETNDPVQESETEDIVKPDISEKGILKPSPSRSPDRLTVAESVDIAGHERNTPPPNNSQDESVRLPIIPKAQGSGIFLPKKKVKRRNSKPPPKKKAKQTLVTISRNRTLPEQGSIDDDDTTMGSILPQINRSQTLVNQTIHQSVLTGPVMLRSPSFVNQTNLSELKEDSQENESEKQKQKEVLKSMSLPQIQGDTSHVYTGDPSDETFLTKHPEADLNSGSSPPSESSTGSEASSDATALVSDITSRLPMSLMIKANQNVNHVVYKRKRKWIEKARRINQSQEALLSDPRYANLKKALVSGEAE